VVVALSAKMVPAGRSAGPVCVVRARDLHRWDDGVLVVSIDCLLPALLAAISPIERLALPF
jgi:hypothetical protein